MTVQPPSLTLIYLCLNEAPSLPATLDEALAFCTKSLSDWEIVVVDDGSTDDSAAIVRAYHDRDARIRLLQHPHNLGMGAGLRTGIAAARKDWFCMLAADGQIPAAELAKMLPALAEAPIVLSTYGNRPNNWLRTFISRGFRWYMRLLIGVSFALEGTYLFPTALARDGIGLDRIGAQTFFFSFELIAQALRQGHRVADTVIASRPRSDGTPSRIANLRQIRRVAAEVWAFRVRERHRQRA
jgi:glycosyltransferase involved in cell wall biosynthesis